MTPRPQWASIDSPAVGRLRYLFHVPAGPGPFPLVCLLHGRGDSADAWMPAFDVLPESVVVAPDAPWSHRASYYVDSIHPGGRSVETAIIHDLIPHLERTFPLAPARESRTIAGYSMGGAGAVRLGLAHPHLFGTIVALSPAVYDPEPPAGSSARTGGAFGTLAARFDASVYRRQSYPALLSEYPAGLPTRVLVAVGTDEQPDPTAPPELAVDVQAERLVAAANRVPGIRATLSRYPGGHGWETWTPALQAALSADE